MASNVTAVGHKEYGKVGEVPEINKNTTDEFASTLVGLNDSLNLRKS